MLLVQVHTALFANEEFVGKSRSGFYGDNVEEMDWAVGAVMRTLREEGVAGNTLTYLSSDNGPFLERGSEGGYAGVLRGGKGPRSAAGGAHCWLGGREARASNACTLTAR